MKIGVLGLGHIGKSLVGLVEQKHEVVVYDPAFHNIYPKKELGLCDFVAICVPTPEGEDGQCDTKIVESAIKKLDNHRVLIRSTVPVGTTKRLSKITGKNICYAPEFIGESPYLLKDYELASDLDFMIIGGVTEDRNYFVSFFETLLGPNVVYYACESNEAEFIKYLDNSFLATKVTFVNEMYDIASTLQVDWNKAREGWLLDKRVGRSHSSVFVNSRGYAGKCLPKDIKALIYEAKINGLKPSFLMEVDRKNSLYQSKSGKQPE